MTDRFERLIKEEKPVILPDEKICFIRTVANIPDCFTEKEWEEIKLKHYIHELGYMSNLSPDYERILSLGLLKARETADEYSRRSIDAIIDLADRYKAEAEKILENYEILKNSGVPHVARIPLIPGITDTGENLKAISEIVGGDRVEVMRYNHLAGAKYSMVGREFILPDLKSNDVDLSVFKNAIML